MLFDLQYLISSLRTFEKIKSAVAKPKHKTLKVLRELIKYWRSKSIRIIMYLDDGLGGADTFEKCKEVSLVLTQHSLC
jgi:hypothetical protein